MAAPPATPRWFPNLSGRIDPITEQAIRYLFGAVYTLQENHGLSTSAVDKTVAALEAKLVAQAKDIAATQVNVAAPPKIVTSGPATVPTPGVPTTNQGSPGGVTPLPSTTPVVTVLPGVSDPLSVVGQVVLIASPTAGVPATPYIFTAPLSGAGPGFWKQDVTNSPSLSDTFANLALYPAASQSLGTVFYATDLKVSYAVQIPSPSNVKTWMFYTGVYQDVLANLPGGLGVNDANFWFRASDYFHNWTWDGAAWHIQFGGGFTPGTFWTTTFQGPLPGGALWQLCDGSTVNVAQDNGTTAAVTTPVVANQYMAR